MSHTAIQKIRPWDQPFWKPAPHKGAVLLYLALIHLLAIVGLLLFPLPSPKVLGLAFVLAALGGFGITVCYHRLLAQQRLAVVALTAELGPPLRNDRHLRELAVENIGTEIAAVSRSYMQTASV